MKKDFYCDNCKHIVDPPNSEPLSEIDKYCDKYNENLVFYDWFWRCQKCYDEYNSADEIED